MKRKSFTFPVTDFNYYKRQMLDWANQFNICCFLDSHEYQLRHTTFQCLLAVGVKRFVSAEEGQAFEALHTFQREKDQWLFGHFSYDLKNETEDLNSLHPDHLHFPALFFFIPEIVLELSDKQVTIHTEKDGDCQSIADSILERKPSRGIANHDLHIQSRFSKQEYLETIERIRSHIHAGDCYELNFCQEFFAEGESIDPLQSYFLLSELSPNPFGAYYKLNDKYVLCASPERYIKKTGDRLISQPIKGTAKRDLSNEGEDKKSKGILASSSKERSENVMIVDLVRNDLSRVCEEGSIEVEELYGIYSFPQVHQMISTVRGQMKKDLHWTDVIKATFPMGSMTGAPKKSVMQLIERYEKTKRGLFSGAIGFVTPENDFDFNVVIRSILYNATNKYISYQVGSGITFYSDPEKEYEECLLKAEAIKKVLA